MIIEIKVKSNNQKVMLNTDNVERAYALNEYQCKVEFVSGSSLTLAMPYEDLQKFLIHDDTRQTLYS